MKRDITERLRKEGSRLSLRAADEIVRLRLKASTKSQEKEIHRLQSKIDECADRKRKKPPTR